MASIRVDILGTSKDFKSALGDAVASTEKANGAFSKMGTVAGRVGRDLAIGIGIGGAAAAVGMKKSLDAAGDFQSKMAVLQATTHGTNAQMAAASKLAIKLGADARLPAVSAGDAADALLQLGKAGFSVQKSMDAARGTLLLATAAETDGATAAKVVTQNINAFGLQAKDTSKIVDEMAGFLNATGTDFAAFADSLTYTAAISHTVGQSFADTTTQLTILSQAGIDGSQAGTGLRTMLAGLGAEGSKASKVFAKVGVDTVGANGQFVGMRSVIQQLTPVFDKMTSSQRLTFLQTAFGKTAMNQANIVLSESVAKYDAAKRAVERKGQADKLAASHMQGYKGAMAQLSSALETLQISFGTKLLPVATRVARFLTSIASAPNISVAIHLALAGIKTVAGDAKKAISDALFGSSQTITIGGEGRATRVVMSQGIISQLQNYDWGKLFTGSSSTITVGGEGRGNAVVVSPGLLGSIANAFQSAMAKINWAAVGKVAGTAIGASIVITTTAFDKFAQTAMAWASAHSGQFATIGLVVGLKMISTLLDPSFWAQHWQLIGGIAISVFPIGKFAGLGAKLAEAGFGKLGALVTPLVLAALEKLPGKVGEIGLSLAIKLGEGILRGVPAAMKIAMRLPDEIVGVISRQFGRLAPIVRVLLNTAIVQQIGNLIGAAVAKAEQLVTGIKNAIQKGIPEIVAFFSALPGEIVGALGDLSNLLYNAGVSILQGLLDGMKAKVGDVIHFASGIAGSIASVKGPITVDKVLLVPHGQAIIEGLLVGMDSRIGDVLKRAASIAGNVATELQNAVKARQAAFQAAWSPLTSSADAAFQKLRATFKTKTEQIILDMQAAAAKANLTGALTAAQDQLTSAQAGQPQTDAEKALAALQAAHNDTGLAQSLSSAQDQLTTAQAPLDPAKVLAAQQAGGTAYADLVAQQNAAILTAQQQVADAQYNIQVDGLNKQITAEQTAATQSTAIAQAQQAVEAANTAISDAAQQASLDKQAAAERLQLDAQDTLQQTHFDAALTRLQAHLASGHATYKQANKAILKLFKSFGVDYQGAGAELGTAFVQGLGEAITAAAKTAGAITSNTTASGVGAAISGARIPHAATGGFVSQSGLAVIHAGETITPAGRGGGDTYIFNGDVWDRQALMEDLRNMMIRSGRNTTGGALGGFA